MEVKQKRVELIELFYDLIYVYAISRLTLLIEEPVSGVIPPLAFFRYLVVSFVILQAWLYMTNYVNRYGRWRWYEYGLTAVNMVAAVYMANTISSDWAGMATTFNLAMLVMLLCVAALYFIQTRLPGQSADAAKNSLLILSIDCLLYLAAFVASACRMGQTVLWIDTVAVLVGAFLPFFIRGKFDIRIISFSHLAERFELITIITFGEPLAVAFIGEGLPGVVFQLDQCALLFGGALVFGGDFDHGIGDGVGIGHKGILREGCCSRQQKRQEQRDYPSYHYQFFFSLLESCWCLRSSTMWANHSTMFGS